MGMIGSCTRFTFCRALPVVVALVAIFIGYLLTQESPLATLFITIYKTVGVVTGKKMTPPLEAGIVAAAAPANAITFTLPSGAKMPAAGIGMCCRPSAYDAAAVNNTVLWYLHKGGRLIDTADMYQNHKYIGDALKTAETMGFKRTDIFVTTKIAPPTYGYESTKAWVPKILDQLSLDHVDLVLMHSPFQYMGVFGPDFGWSSMPCGSMDNCYKETWQALCEARAAGLIRDVGVSNFPIGHLEKITSLAEAKTCPVAVNQIEYNAWNADAQAPLVKYCKENKITLTGYFTMGGSHQVGAALAAETLARIAEKKGRSTAQVLNRWSIQKGVAVIPGTGSPKWMNQNINLYDFELTEAEMQEIDRFGAEDDTVKAMIPQKK